MARFDQDTFVEQVRMAASAGLSQAQVADLFFETPSKIHRISKKYEIKFNARRGRTIGNTSESKDANKASGAHDGDNAEAGGDARQTELFTKPRRAAASADNAKRRSLQDIKSDLAKLCAASKSKQEAEEHLGKAMLEYEHNMWLEKLREAPLPKSFKEIGAEKEFISKSVKIADLRRQQYNQKQMQRLLDAFPDCEELSATQAAALVGESVSRTSSYLNKLMNSNMLSRERRLVSVDVNYGRGKKQHRWIYWKNK